jgi:hypothetical protein
MLPNSSRPPNPTHPPKKRRSIRRFTPEEDAVVLEHCHTVQGVTRAAKALGRNRSVVRRRADQLGLSPQSDPDDPPQGRLTQWQTHEDAIVLARYAIDGPQVLASSSPLAGIRSRRAITKRAAILGVSFQPNVSHAPTAPWSPEEIRVLTDFLNSDTNGLLRPAVPGRTPSAVDAQLLNLRAGRRRSKTLRPWSAEEDHYLRKHYHVNGAQVASDALGRSLAAVHNRASELGIRHDPSVSSKKTIR